MTFIKLVRRIAERNGMTVSAKEADYILWEFTEFPVAHIKTIVRQVRDYFAAQAKRS